ncbi:MAG: cyclic nucleotide-binding domain-containing protein [PVC group bacterium]
MADNEKKLFPPVSLEFLRTHSLFGGIKDDELKKIRELLKYRQFNAGEDIIREGEAGGNLYLIWKGSVEVIKRDPEKPGRPAARLAVLTVGDSFGEMELIDVQPSAATVRSREETVTLVLTKGDLYRIEKESLRTFTMIIMNLAREISRRLRVMDATAAHTLFRNTN